ncbi:hypothetical protein ACFYXP_34785, partial [Streptomyces sp. NPDC002466]
LPGNGPSQFLDPDGTIYNAAGDIVQHAKDAPTGNPAASADTPHTDAPKTDSPATAEIPERELAGVGGRNGDDTTRLGSDTPDPLHAGDHIPGTRPDTTPGGHAPDHMPRNHLDNTPSSSSSGGNGPTDHTNTPGTGPAADRFGSHPETNHETSADGTGNGHGGNTQTGGSHGASGGEGLTQASSHPGDSLSAEAPRPFERGGETERQIRENLPGSKVKPNDLETALANLAKHPVGQRTADLIASGRFNDLTNYNQVVSSLAQKSETSGGIEQLLLADRLQKNGVTDISFEIKRDIEIKPGVFTGRHTDMDVMARDVDGKIYGYQFKEIKDPSTTIDKIWKHSKQLNESGADVKIFVVDTKGSMADMVASGIQKDLARFYDRKGLLVVIRVEDGTLMYPPGSRFVPGDLP